MDRQVEWASAGRGIGRGIWGPYREGMKRRRYIDTKFIRMELRQVEQVR